MFIMSLHVLQYLFWNIRDKKLKETDRKEERTTELKT